MKIKDFNIIKNETVLNPESFCPMKKILVEIFVEYEAQYDGHSMTKEKELEYYYQSAYPMLDQINESIP